MNILVVDDDALIRNWLSMLLRQARGAEVSIFEATDGVDALEFCEENRVDLVITDIKMPRMNGIDLIGTLKTEYPEIRTAVLSSYDDFDYVRIALKCGALDYIRKAEMQLEDITLLLEKTQHNIELEQKLKKEDTHQYSALADIKHSFSRYLKQPEQLEEDFLRAIEPPLSAQSLCLALLRLKKSVGADVPQYLVAGICDDTLRSEGLTGTAFPWGREYYVVFFNYPQSSPEQKQDIYQKLLGILDNNLNNYTALPISNSIKIDCVAEETLRAQFYTALDIMDFRQYYKIAAPRLTKESGVYRKQQAQEMKRALAIKDYQEAVRLLLHYLTLAHDAQLSPRRVKTQLVSGMNMLMAAISPVAQAGEVIERLSGYPGIVMEAYEKERLMLATRQFCVQYLDYVQSVHSELSPSVRDAVRYIEAHYARKITLDEVAKHVFLNRSYLSQIFKKEVGVSFGDYIENFRVERAKFLIQEGNHSMSEIAEAVGFSNQNYFTKVFKKATGVSPLKFRRYS